MNLSELQDIILKSVSSLMKEEGQKIVKEGLADSIKGKRIDNIYHIYGTVKNKNRTQEFNTHIKVNLLTKKLEGISCNCDDFKELSAGNYSFMCSHLTATAFKFLGAISKNNAKGKNETEETPDENPTKTEPEGTARLVRKVSKDLMYYEAWLGHGTDKIIIKPENLRSFLENIPSRKIKFKYEHLEFTAPIFHKNLPLTFNIKERNEQMVLTTHLKFPIPLNEENSVYLYKNELFVPSKEQVERYLPLYEKLKKNGEIVYHKNINNYNRLLNILNSITSNINISEDLKSFIAGFIKPGFYLYSERNQIYCEVKLQYGNEEINILKESSGSERILRDYKREERILMDIEKYYFIRRKDRFIFIGGDEELFHILSGRGKSIRCLGNVIFGRGMKEMRLYTAESIEAALKENGEYLAFSYGIRDMEPQELNSAFAAYKENSRFYKTRDNGFLDFEDEGVSNLFNLLEALNVSENLEEGLIKIEKNKALYLNENIKSNNIGFIKGADILKAIEDRMINIDTENMALPKNLRKILREYQINGFKWLKGLSHLNFGGILADEMGLGKTLQTIAFLASEEDKKTLIVCPTSLIYNWKDEFNKFAPQMKIGIVHGEKQERVRLVEKLYEYDVLLTTYGTLRMDIEQYGNIAFDYCIIDEGQNIKNSQALNTKVVKEVKAGVRFALTGTPIENNLTELWSIVDFIMPGYLYNQETFEEKFIIGREENLESLKLLIKPFILRRTKAEVMKELPDKIERKFLVEMTTAQKAIYGTYIKNVREIMKNNPDGRIEGFSYLTKLRQICLDPSLIIDEYQGGSGKLRVALDLIRDHIYSEGKLLLFSQFTSVLDKIGESLKDEGIEYYQLEGSTRPKERIRLVNEFNNRDDIKVFLISLKAGGTGLNLTSANLVIHFDPWWNPAVEDQATDRAHRIGQRNVVEVIKLVAQGTIEEKIILLQEDKKELIDSIITGELQNTNLLGKLSKEELLKLFSR